MDICVLNPFFYPYKGGTEKVILEVYKRIAKEHNVTILTSGEDGGKEVTKEEVFGINVVRVKTKYHNIPELPLPFLTFQGLDQAISEADADIYHINNRYQYFYRNIRTIKSKGKLALTIHNSLPMKISPMTDTLGLLYDACWGRAMMKEADVISGVSQNTIDVTVLERDLHKCHVIYNGVDYNVFRKIEKNDKLVRAIRNELGFEGETILLNGRFVRQKGHIYLMKAVRELQKKGIEVNLLFLGKGPDEDKIYLKAQKLGIGRRLGIRGDLGDEALPYYYAASDISAAPSLYEPASLVALESMACELPIVASKVGGLPEMVGDCGSYTKPRDYQGLAKRIEELLYDNDSACDLGRRGRERVIKRHSWDKIAQRYEELFLNTIRS